MKVAIIDDEVYICKLVRHLIRWEELGLTLLGLFQDGDELLAQFAREPADILICDIEMPKKSGIELLKIIRQHYPRCKCIVISGFRNFDYVRSAMQNGTVDYLLKPIDEEELNRVLESVTSSKREADSAQSIVAEQTARMGLQDVIFSGMAQIDIPFVNRRFHYNFQKGYFNALFVAYSHETPFSEQIEQPIKRLNDTIRHKLSDVCYDLEVFWENAVAETWIFNYSQDNEAHMHFILDRVLSEGLAEVASMSGARFTIGVGYPGKTLDSIQNCISTAKIARCNCFFAREKQLFYAAASGQPDRHLYRIAEEDKKELNRLVEQIRPEKIEGCLCKIFRNAETQLRKSPELIYSLSNQLLECFIGAMDGLRATGVDKQELRKQFQTMFCNMDSLSTLVIELATLMAGCVEEHLAFKQNNATLYVQQAKNYIEKHYAQQVTLELIAEQLHINAVYLSVVFKNEVGMNYSKYLTGVRMEHAKQLLKEPHTNITQIANAVGYDSTYYFSSLFQKTVGIKPSEYRRLHQQDMTHERPD